jgi:hypothetical protein
MCSINMRAITDLDKKMFSDMDGVAGVAPEESTVCGKLRCKRPVGLGVEKIASLPSFLAVRHFNEIKPQRKEV